MSGMPWIKSKTTQLSDPRIMRLSERARLHYFELYLLAGTCDAEGSFILNDERLTDDEIAFHLRTDPKHLKATMKELKASKLIHVNGHGPVITDFVNEQVSQAKRQESWKERQQRHRDVTRDNSVTDKASRESHRTRDQSPEKETRDQSKRKRPATPNPSPNGKKPSGRQAGTHSKKSESSPVTMNKTQTRRADKAAEVLRSCGLRNPLLKETSVQVATRIFKNDDEMLTYLFAAIASTFSDQSVKSPEAVAAYRIEHDQVPQRFEDPKLWRSVPVKALEAAGIKDLDNYIRSQKYGGNQ